MVLKIGLAILIVAALVFGGLFFSDYLGQSSSANTLRSEIKTDNAAASTMSKQNQTLQAEIDSINNTSASILNDIAEARKVIAPKTNPNKIVEDVLTLGGQQLVTVIPLTTSPWASTKVGKNSYSVFKMTVEINGAQDRLVAFVRELQRLEHQPLIIENLTLNKPASTPTLFPTPSPTATPVVDSNITLNTYDATDVTTTMAGLNGNLTSLGTDTGVSVSFQYGHDLAYGGVTPEVMMTSEGLFKAAINHLSPGTTYHFRAKAVGSATVFGEDKTFSTPLDPAPTPIPENTYMTLALAIYAQ
jgi:hypothetical protein